MIEIKSLEKKFFHPTTSLGIPEKMKHKKAFSREARANFNRYYYLSNTRRTYIKIYLFSLNPIESLQFI